MLSTSSINLQDIFSQLGYLKLYFFLPFSREKSYLPAPQPSEHPEMSGGQQDIRALVHALAYPQSNDAYLRDQQTLTDLYKQPGMCCVVPVPLQLYLGHAKA